MGTYVVNWRLLVASLVAVSLLMFGLHRVHRKQVNKLTAVYKQEAEAAEAKREFPKAIEYLRRYLALAPGDTDRRARLGTLMLGTSATPVQKIKAYYVFDEVIRRDPGRSDIRRTCAELGLVFGPDFVGQTQSHLKALQAEFPRDGVLDAMYGDTCVMAGLFKEAVEHFAAAVDKNPDLYAAYTARALILREKLDEPQSADRVVADMFHSPLAKTLVLGRFAPNGFWDGAFRALVDQADPAPAAKSFEAWLASAKYWEQIGRLDNYAQAVASAKRIAPDELPVRIMYAQLLMDRAVEQGARGDAAGQKATHTEARNWVTGGLQGHTPEVGTKPEDLVTMTTEQRERRTRIGGLFNILVTLEIQSGDLAAAEDVARRGTAALPENGNLAVSLVEVQIRRGDAAEAEKGVSRLRTTNYPPGPLTYHQARIRMLREDWVGAARTLAEALRDTTLGDLAPSAHFLAGTCYEQLGELDRRYEHFRTAADTANRRDQLWYQATERVAATRAEMGLVEEAVRTYRILATRAPGANAPLARLLLTRTLSRKPQDRDWTPVAEAVGRIPEGVDAEVLKAELAAATDKLDDARTTLTAAAAKYPKEPSPLLALAVLESRAKADARSAAALAEARKKFGDTADIRMTEAAMLALPSAEASARLLELADNLSALPKAEQQRLLRGLSNLAGAAGASDAALRLRSRSTEIAPHDLGAYLAQFDAALYQKNQDAALKALARIRAIDGTEGSAARTADVLFNIWKAQMGDRNVDLAALDNELAAIARQRPWWGRVALAQGLVADLRGDRGQAALRYRDAIINGGERRPEVIRRLLEIYADRQLFREAEALIFALPERAGEFAGSELLVADLSVRSGNLGRALEYAARGIPEDSKDAAKLVYLAQLRRLNRRPDAEIERPLRRAVEVGATTPGPWVALVQHLAGSGRRADAEKEMENAGRSLTGPTRSLALAQCREAVGDTEGAKKAFVVAVDENPRNLNTLRAAASFSLSADDPARVEDLARRILDLQDVPPEDKQFALRLLALVVSMRGSEDARRDVLVRSGVLEGGLPTRLSGTETLDQLRTRAVAFAVQPDADLRRKAAEALEAIEAKAPLFEDDEFLLAKIHVSVGEWARARRRLTALAGSNSRNPNYPAALVTGLIRYDADPAAAREYLAALEKLQPGAIRTVELTARVLDAEGKTPAAAAALVAFADKDPKNVGPAAAVLQALGQENLAEPLFRRLAADPARTDGAFLLAGNLGRIGRTREALATIRDVAVKFPPPVVAAAGVEVLHSAPRIDPADAKLVEDWIAAVPNTPANRSIILQLTGTLRTIQERYDEATAAYRELTSKGPPNASLLNNYAYLVGVRGRKFDEAAALIETAKRAGGPRALFRDTEGLILIEKGDFRAAIDVLGPVARESHDPVAYFHLALAYEKAGSARDCFAAMRVAKRLKIRPADVVPGERGDLARLLAGV